MENENPRILVLWKKRIREFSFCGKRESENSSYVKNEISRFVENENQQIFVLSEIPIREFPFCGDRESENLLFVENENSRIPFL